LKNNFSSKIDPISKNIKIISEDPNSIEKKKNDKKLLEKSLNSIIFGSPKESNRDLRSNYSGLFHSAKE